MMKHDLNLNSLLQYSNQLLDCVC